VNQNIQETTLYNSPQTFLDKKNEPIIIKLLDNSAHHQLFDMYLHQVPRNSFDGLPPIRDDACTKWVQGMIDSGIHLGAFSIEEGLVGHAALFPMNEHTCEMFLVVAPYYQHAGIGSQLTRCTIQLANELHYEKNLAVR
jgi:hypothetical protein